MLSICLPPCRMETDTEIKIHSNYTHIPADDGPLPPPPPPPPSPSLPQVNRNVELDNLIHASNRKRFAKPLYINVNLKYSIQFIYFFLFSLLFIVVVIIVRFLFIFIWFDCIQTIYLLTLIVHCRFMIIDKIHFEGCACYQKVFQTHIFYNRS